MLSFGMQLCDHHQQTDAHLQGATHCLGNQIEHTDSTCEAVIAVFDAELLHDSHLTKDGATTPTKAVAGNTKGPKASTTPAKASVKIKAKKPNNMREPDFKVQRPWGGFHTAA